MSVSTTAVSANGADPEAPVTDAPAPSGADVFAQITSLLPNLHEQIAAIDGERQQIVAAYDAAIERLNDERRGKLAVLEDKRRRLMKVVAALGDEPEPPARPSRATRRQGAQRQQALGHVAAWKFKVILEEILRRGDEPFTASAVHQAVEADWHMSATHTAINRLNHAEIIRRTDREGKAWRYRLWDRDKAEQLRTELGERAAADTHAGARPSDSGSGHRVPRVALDRTIEVIRAASEPISAPQISEALGYKSPTEVYSSVKQLLAIGFLEHAGTVGERPRQQKVYRIADETALAKLEDGDVA